VHIEENGMTESMNTQSSALPDDDFSRQLTVANPDIDETLPHLAVVGDTYTVVLSGKDTAGKYTLLDMMIPSAENGPPPHRHDYEEMYYLLEGQIELTVRDETVTLKRGDAVNIPANAPHFFRSHSGVPARFLCMTISTNLEDFFTDIGTPVATRTTLASPLNAAQQEMFMGKVLASAPRQRMELLPPS
jgi:mannose-6-phosphate isomerase-like protein (cupin superfamily)